MDEQFGQPSIAATLARKLGTACALPLADLLLVAVSWSMIAMASLVIALLPSRRILRTLGSNLGAVSRAPAADVRQRAHAERIARAIGIAGRNAPFRADCYPQALAAAQLCRWFAVPHAVQLGARFAAAGSARSGGLEGHVWVRCDALTICGGSDSAQQFGTVACYVHTPRSTDADAVA